jgi:hypothetical protein
MLNKIVSNGIPSVDSRSSKGICSHFNTLTSALANESFASFNSILATRFILSWLAEYLSLVLYFSGQQQGDFGLPLRLSTLSFSLSQPLLLQPGDFQFLCSVTVISSIFSQ